MKKITSLFCLLLIISVPAVAQYYSTGADPGSIRWRQIKTEKFQLIYPSDFETKSQYLANILEIIARADTQTLHAKMPRIPVIIHQQSATSNGVTVWAPKRIELYPCPPQDSYAEEWLEQLATHEYRHAVQTAKMNKGFTRVLSYLFGEQAPGAVLGLYLPLWFLEGDAVCTETALSRSGRGRLPSFESTLRAQVLEKGTYRYDKAVLGSYRTFIPDQYSLGYFLVAGTRKKYGPQVWDYTLDRVAKLPFIIIPFTSGIKRTTGLSKVKLYKQVLSDLDKEWSDQASGIQYTGMKLLSRPDKKNFSVYAFPLYLNDSVIIAFKESMNDIDRIVRIDAKNKQEKKVFTPGYFEFHSLSYSEGLLLWTESVPDIRWENRDFTRIRIYDMNSHKARFLTGRSRYFAASLSPDGKMVCAVRLSLTNRSSIVILDVNSGNVMKEFDFGNKALAIIPGWDDSNTRLAVVLLTVKGKAMGVIDILSGKYTEYIPPSYHEISGPTFLSGNLIMFSGDYSGIENIYAIDTSTRKIWQVTSAKFGSGAPYFNDDHTKMLYSDYCSDGLMIAETGIDTVKWTPLEQVGDRSIKLYASLVSQEKTNIQDSVRLRNLYKIYESDNYDLIEDSIKGRQFPSRKYSKWLHLFNFHSWAPASIDVNNLMVDPGVSVLSQNVLGTAVASAGYDYNVNEGTGKAFANFSYQGLYPVFDLTFSYGGRSAYYYNSTINEVVPFGWEELNFSGTVSIPWNFTRGKYYRYLTPSVGISMIDVIHYSKTPDFFTEGLIPAMNYKLSFSNTLKSVPKDMYPKWSQQLYFNFRNSPFAGNTLGSIVSGETYLFFPGIFNHHSLWFYGGIQKNTPNPYSNYRFSDFVNYPRGYSGAENTDLISLEFNYKLPLFYPDLSIGSLLYLKRFKLNLFYDMAEGWGDGYRDSYKSTGAELTVDLHLLRFTIPFELGVRGIYFPGAQTTSFEFLYAVRY